MGSKNLYSDHYKGKTILVAGGAGAVGSRLTKKLCDLGAESVVVIDDLSSAYKWNIPDEPNLLFIKGSITDEVTLKRAFAEKPEIVFHLAAFLLIRILLIILKPI